MFDAFGKLRPSKKSPLGSELELTGRISFFSGSESSQTSERPRNSHSFISTAIQLIVFKMFGLSCALRVVILGAIVQVCLASKIEELSILMDSSLTRYGRLRITWDLVKQASDEYMRLSEETKLKMDTDPKSMLLVDFALVPANLMEDMITERDDELYFVDKLISAYNYFKPSYMEGKLLGDPPKVVQMDKCNRIYKIGIGRLAGRLTLKDFLDAQTEAANWRQAAEVIRREENIYGNLQTLERILNSYNHTPLTILITEVFPLVNRNSDPAQLLTFYRERLVAYGYTIMKPQEKEESRPKARDGDRAVAPENESIQ